MKKIILYSYLKCSTCRKASKWLEQNNISFQLKDIIKETPPKDFLELALIQFALDKKRLFNTRGKNFKLLDIDIKNETDAKIIELLSNDGKLIKRPFLIINETKIILGFSETEYAQNFR